MMLLHDEDCISLGRLWIFAFGRIEAPCCWEGQVTNPGIIRFPMEPHTEEGIAPGVPEAELTIQGKRRSVKKGVIPTLRMLEVTCACVAGACVHLRSCGCG